MLINVRKYKGPIKNGQTRETGNIGGKDEPNSGYVRKSLWTLQLETQNGLYADAR